MTHRPPDNERCFSVPTWGKIETVFTDWRSGKIISAPWARHLCSKPTRKIPQAPSGAKSSEYAAPTGLEIGLVFILHRCRAYGASRRKASRLRRSVGRQTAVFGVSPNTFLNREPVGETPTGVTGTVALPYLSRFRRNSARASRATARPLNGFKAANALSVSCPAICRDFSRPTIAG